jgi:hypothetical protein
MRARRSPQNTRHFEKWLKLTKLALRIVDCIPYLVVVVAAVLVLVQCIGALPIS